MFLHRKNAKVCSYALFKENDTWKENWQKIDLKSRPLKRNRFWNNFFNDAKDFESRFSKRVRFLANFTRLNRLLIEGFTGCQVLKWNLYSASDFEVKRTHLKVSKTSQNADKEAYIVSNFELKLAISVRFWIKILHRVIFWKKMFLLPIRFESTILPIARFWTIFFATRPILNRWRKNVSDFKPIFYISSKFDWRFLQRTRYCH